jgi:hypothetical protein
MNSKIQIKEFATIVVRSSQTEPQLLCFIVLFVQKKPTRKG